MLTLEYLVNLLVQVARLLNLVRETASYQQRSIMLQRRITHGATQLQHGLPSNQGFLVIVLDLDVDDVDRSIEFASSIQKICDRVRVECRRSWLNAEPTSMGDTHRRTRHQSNALRM